MTRLGAPRKSVEIDGKSYEVVFNLRLMKRLQEDAEFDFYSSDDWQDLVQSPDKTVGVVRVLLGGESCELTEDELLDALGPGDLLKVAEVIKEGIREAYPEAVEATDEGNGVAKRVPRKRKPRSQASSSVES